MSIFSFEHINTGNNSPSMNSADEKKHLFLSLFIPGVFIALIWIIQLFVVVTGVDLVSFGLLPNHISGLKGILFSPLIHGDWNHLISNSIPFFVLGFLMIFNYRKVAFKSFIFIYLVSGILVWLTGRENYHIGASGLVYGMAFFIFFSGVFRKNIQAIALSLFVVFMYGSIVWGLLPMDPTISWEGHLMGALCGSFIAFYYRKTDLPPVIELEDDNEEEDEAPPEPEPLTIVYSYKETTNTLDADRDKDNR